MDIVVSSFRREKRGAIVARVRIPLARACIYSSHVHRGRRDVSPRLSKVGTGRDGANRRVNCSRSGRTWAERTRSVNGFIFSTEKRGNGHQLSVARAAMDGVIWKVT